MKAKIDVVNGNRVFNINGKIYTPAAFRSFRPTPANISLFYRNGVRLFQMQLTGKNTVYGLPYSYFGGAWTGDHEYDFTPIDRQLDMFKSFAPDGKYMIMIQLDTPDWWLKQHQGCTDSYTKIGEAFFYDDWIADACDYLTAAVEYIESHYGNDIFAYSFSAGSATEWFDCTDFYTPSAQKAAAFAKDNGGMLPPSADEIYEEGECIRQPNSNSVRWRDWCCTLTPQLINRFAATLRNATGGNKIIGLFFGYTDCPSAGYQLQSATNGYESVWHNKNIDMLFSPASYSYGDDCRELSGASSYQVLVDSIALHDKLYLHEIDHRTHLAAFPLENGMILGDCQPDEYSTVQVLRRELAAVMQKGGSLWWFDFFGGYYACPALENELKEQLAIINTLAELPHKSVSEIAVFADPMGFNMYKDSLNITSDLVRYCRNGLQSCGAPFDYYNLSDLPLVDTTQYKMFVFLCAPRIDNTVRMAIERLSGKLKVWLHLPDVASGDTLDYTAAQRICGMSLKQTEPQKAVIDDTEYGFTNRVTPIFAVNDADAQPISYYADKSVCAAYKNDNAYIGVGRVPAQLWRRLAEKAGVFLYSDSPCALYADNRFIACSFPGERGDVISLQQDGEYIEAYSKTAYRTKNKRLTFAHTNYQTMLFIKQRDER